jgi:hypothetical protein
VRQPIPVSDDRPQRVELDRRYLDPVDLASVRQQVTNLVANRALELVHEILEHIARGNYQAMKYLFEMVGLFPAAGNEEASAGDSLTKTLLNYLGGTPEESPSSRQAAPRGQSEKVDADAVK